MRILAILILSCFYSASPPKSINIDTSKTVQLKVSDIAESVKAIPLGNTGFELKSIAKVFFIYETIYLLEVDPDEGPHGQRVLKFDLSGNYLGQIGAKDPLSNKFLRTFMMFYDETSERIYINSPGGYSIHDRHGNLIDFRDNVRASIIFNNRFWANTEHSYNFKDSKVNLESTDLDGTNVEIIEGVKVEIPEEMKQSDIMMFPGRNISIRSGQLYISFKINNTIYRLHNNKLYPEYIFNLINGTPTYIDFLLAPSQEVIGDYIKFGYRLDGESYDFLYNKRLHEGYNIRHIQSNPNPKGSLNAGVRDDIYNTGYFDIKTTNIENHIYFIKRPTDIKESSMFNPEQLNPVIFLVKLL